MIGNIFSPCSFSLGAFGNVNQKFVVGVDDAVAAAAITGVASLIGDIFSSSSTSSTNKTNLKIAQMNNEYNEKMLQETMDYNTQERLDTQQYNSAVAQRARYEEAGLNPYLRMNGGSAGTSTAQSSPQAPRAESVTMQPTDFSGMFSSVGDTIAQFLNAQSQQKSVESQAALNESIAENYRQKTEQVMIENKYKAQEIINGLDLSKAQKDLLKNQSDVARMDYLRSFGSYNADMNKARIEANNAELYGRLLSAQTVSEQLKAKLNWKELKYFDDRALAELSTAAATAYSLYAQGKCSYAAAENYVKNTLKAQEETKGIKIDNDTKQKVQQYVIDNAKKDAYSYGYSFVDGIGISKNGIRQENSYNYVPNVAPPKEIKIRPLTKAEEKKYTKKNGY